MGVLTAGGTGQSGQVIPSADHCFFCLLGQSVGSAIGEMSSIVNVKTVLKEGNECFVFFKSDVRHGEIAQRLDFPCTAINVVSTMSFFFVNFFF